MSTYTDTIEHTNWGDPFVCYNMDEPWIYNAKWNKLVAKGQILYNSTFMKYLK